MVGIVDKQWVVPSADMAAASAEAAACHRCHQKVSLRFSANDESATGAYKGLCSLQLTGANKLVPLLAGGLDGIYKLHTCENGRPAFKRATGPEEGQDSTPNECNVLHQSF